MGFEVLIWALARIQHTWPGSNKHTNRILKDLLIQIGNRDHQTVVQSWSSVTSFKNTTSLWLRLSPSAQRKKEKREDRGRREDRKKKKKGELREELDDLNEDKRTLKMKDLNERQRTVSERIPGWRRKKKKRGGEEEEEKKRRGRNISLRVVDTVSAAAIGVRKTHQRFVCSVRVN